MTEAGAAREATFGCRCGAVRGRVAPLTPRVVNRAVCYCDDCQAAAHHLGRADLLDPRGGSDIVQIAPARLQFRQGAEEIAGFRLKPKGILRFYARCCRTPMGNMVSPAIPFVGLPSAIFDGAAADRLFGPPRVSIMGQFAIGGAPPGTKGFPLRALLPALVKVLGWRLAGLGRPHPFFAPGARAPTPPVSVLTPAERERLRPLCGPNPQTF